MALFLKQSTAVDVLIGPFVDSANGYTSEEGLSPAVEISKNGQALAARNGTPATPTVDDFGYYNCELDATDTGTLGTLVLAVEGTATALPVRHEYMVIPANAYDALFGGTDVLQADVTQWLGQAAATPTVNGVPEVDVTHYGGGAVPAPAQTGVPDVNVTYIQDGAVPAPAATGVPDVNVTYYGDGAVPATAATGVPDVNVTHLVDSTASATSLKRSADGVIFGTSSGTPTTTSTNSDLSLNGDDRVIDRTIVFISGTGAYQAGKITDYANTSGVVTWSQTFAVAPVSGDTFIII
jgi:hypothetical protein